jgi:hypothetical protein
LVNEDASIKQVFTIKNALSAYVYLITWFLSEFSKLKETKEANITKNKRRVAKKDRTSDEQRNELEQNAT